MTPVRPHACETCDDLSRIAKHARCCDGERGEVASGWAIFGAFKLCAQCSKPFPLELRRVPLANGKMILRDQPRCRACRVAKPNPDDGPELFR